MTLAARFVEQHAWPDSRKVLWLAGTGFPFQVLGSSGLAIPLADSDAVDVRGLVLINSLGALILGAFWIIGAMAYRAGHNARPLPFLLTGSFAAYIMWVIHGLGTWSTIFIFWVPMIVLLAALWFDATVAVVALVWQVVLLTGWTVAERLSVVDYAPLIEDRSLDAQDSAAWTAASIIGFSSAIGISIALALLAAVTRDLQESRLQQAFTLIRRYVPGQVAEALLANPDADAEAHERRRLTIFFSDLVGFTDLSDELEPEDLSRLLNEYFAEMTAIAHEYGGTIDELSGDAILVFFGAPEATNDRDHALRAVKMARDMQTRLDELNERWSAEGRADRLEARIGINTGVVTVGNFGSPERMKYAALGRHVNAAARLQTSCPPGGILLTHGTWMLVRDEIPCSPNGELTLKGLHKPVGTYLVDTLR